MGSQLEPKLGFSPSWVCLMNWCGEHLGATPSEDEEVVGLTCQEKRQRQMGSTWEASDFAWPSPTAESQNSAERRGPLQKLRKLFSEGDIIPATLGADAKLRCKME